VTKLTKVERSAADGSVVKFTGAEEPIEAIREAVKSGINFIDTSPFYGLGVSEFIVGQVSMCLTSRAL
jgi:aryl-alcohol dehydrogenase-like predicted oxidoreductase